jgi:diguanylate cyclase (GGDEF)-like protein/putative nucleotidyltransferase with HDIG domain
VAVTTAPESTAAPYPGKRAATPITTAARGVEAAVLPLAIAAAAACLLATFARTATAGELARFCGLALLGLSAHAFIARADRARAGHGAAVVVLPAGAVLLPLDLLVSLALVVSVPRSLWPRAPRLTRAVELATEVAAAIASWLTAAAAYALAAMVLDADAAWALAGMVACGTFVAADQLAALGTGRLEGRLSHLRAPPLSLGTKLLLATVGAAIAAVCLTNPWLAPFAVAPLLLLRQWFEIPLLEHQARRDAKTGLFNANYFEVAVERALAQAKAAEGTMSVLLADLDLLREINNAHGHLAGDAVLRGVGGVLQEHLRPQDVPARFGGEEFAVLLPDTTTAEALEIAERLRAAVAATRFLSGTADTELQATVSVGVASYPEHGTEAVQLIHQADVAVYGAKLQGRNRVHAATDGAQASLSSSLRLATGWRRSDAGGAAAIPRLGPASWLATRRSGPIATLVGVTTLAALAVLGISQASYLTAMLAPAIGGVAILVLRRETMVRAERDSAAIARERAEELRRGADTLRTLNRSLQRANGLLRDRSAAAMETLSAAVDARDSHTAGHSRRVQTLAMLLGRELDLSDAELEVLNHAALFHDVGKLAVPEAILLKQEKLGDLDWVVVRRHPEEGARLIEHLGFLEDALPAIRHHHEHYDGSGYPGKLAGEDIPLGARIIHLADALDAMLTSRPYRPALEPLAALEEIRGGAGAQFCPRCVDALDAVMLAEFAKGADVPHELLAS